jgi:hypothetical protein
VNNQSIKQSSERPHVTKLKSLLLWASITARHIITFSTSVSATAVDDRYFVPVDVRDTRKKRIKDVVWRTRVIRLAYFKAFEVAGAGFAMTGLNDAPSRSLRLIVLPEKKSQLKNPRKKICRTAFIQVPSSRVSRSLTVIVEKPCSEIEIWAAMG